MDKSVSQAELARYLGLSDWTVSRAINGHPLVKESTRQRVLEAMREIGFQPNPLARGLSGKRTGLVGIIFSELQHPVLLEKLTLFESFLHKHEFRSLLAFTGMDEASELRAIADFKRLRVDAIVLVQSTLGKEPAAKLLSGCCKIHVDPIAQQHGPSVLVDRNRGVELLIDHLYELGHRYFGTMGILEINSWRWLGLIKAFNKYGLDPQKHLRQYLPPDQDPPMRASYEMGIDLARKVLEDPKAPTALLAINDHVALSAAQYWMSQGQSVPGRFSITGFDHVEVSRFLRPRLTTIDHEPALLMEAAGHLLLKQLEGKAAVAQTRQITPRLIVGESTGPVAAR